MFATCLRDCTLTWLLVCVGSSTYAPYAQTCPAKCRCNAEYRTVDCSPTTRTGVRLRHIPPDIPPNTRDLNLSNNKFSWLRNTSFPDLPELRKLSLFRCKIKHIDAGVFLTMSRLEFLDLSGNQLRDEKFVKLDSLEFLDGLKVLNLSGSRMKPTVLNSIKSKSLRSLDLSLNRIKDLSFGDSFQMQIALKYVSLSGNPIRSFDKTAFENLRASPLSELRLNNCYLITIPSDAFKPLKHLQTLWLANNPIKWNKPDFDAVLRSMCGIPLRSLYLQNLSISNITGSFSCFHNLVTLELTSNAIQRIENGTFSFTNRLQNLSLANNKIEKIDRCAMKGLLSLRSINFERNRLRQVPVFSHEHGMSYVPKVRLVNLQVNAIEYTRRIYPAPSAFTGLENLQRLQIASNSLRYLDDRLLSPLRKLKILEAGSNKIKRISRTTFQNMTQLFRIDLLNNNLKLLNDDYFKGLAKLDELILGQNDFSQFDDWPNPKAPSPNVIFSGLRSLRKLNLNYVGLEYLREGYFASLQNLTKLFLNGNKFSSWSPRTFQNLVSLQVLSIVKCQVYTINSSMLQPVMKTLKRFDGFSNPFACECKLRWFISWLEKMNSSSNASTSVLGKPYKCLSPKRWHGLSIFEYGRNTTDNDCTDFNWLLVVATASGTLVFVAVAISSIAYYHRWSIRYWLFLLRSRRKKNIPLRRREDFEYDCFITYSSLDTEFVVRDMLPKLEEENDLRVCIHERNFHVGGDITENIEESIETSRKIVVLLTENYVKSYWCKLEINMAHAKLLDERMSREAMIIIMKENVSMKHMTPILRHLIRKQTYIQWNGDNPIVQATFWRRLIQAITCDVHRREDDP